MNISAIRPTALHNTVMNYLDADNRNIKAIPAYLRTAAVAFSIFTGIAAAMENVLYIPKPAFNYASSFISNKCDSTKVDSSIKNELHEVSAAVYNQAKGSVFSFLSLIRVKSLTDNLIFQYANRNFVVNESESEPKPGSGSGSESESVGQ